MKKNMYGLLGLPPPLSVILSAPYIIMIANFYIIDRKIRSSRLFFSIELILL